MKHLEFEYGAGTMGADLPDSTDVFIPGETVQDPPFIPEDRLEEAYLESIRNPIGMKPVTELVHKGSKVVFVVPDRVKGGEQKTSHRKLSIKSTVSIPAAPNRTQKRSSARKSSMLSGAADRSFPMTRKIRNI